VAKSARAAGDGPPPLILRWQEPDNPLPLRTIRPPGSPPGAHATRLAAQGPEPPPWRRSGPEDRPFDFGAHVRRLCADMVRHSDALRHIDVSRLLFGVLQARSARLPGLQARVTPLRCRGGALMRRRQGRSYQVQRFFVNGVEMLYLVTFCLPRFLDQDFDDKFITLFHELYHISPAFDGDLRRHAGRCDLHSNSKRLYDAHMADLARSYLSNGADHGLHDFLRLNFAQLRRRHGRVVGVSVPRPRLVAVQEDSPQRHKGHKEEV
jgi:predicted metallopeptidase